MKKRIDWTSEQHQYLSDNRNTNRKELLQRFNLKFGTNITLSALKGFMQRNNLSSDFNGRFGPGHEPWNKGISRAEYFSHYDKEKTLENCKKMHEKNRTLTLGEERIINGIPHICTVAGRRTQRYERWVRKKYIVWEQTHGAIPENHCIIHLDGNQMNCDISNLACIPKEYMGLLCKNKWFSKNKLVTKTAIKWCELHLSLKQSKEVSE